MLNNKYCKAISLILILCFMFSLTSCSGGIFERRSDSYSLPQPNPLDGIRYMINIPLYYRLMDSEYLLPVMEEIKMQSNEMPEAAILRALISGVGTNDVYTNAIPPETELVDITLNGEMLFVTLNNAFTDSKNYNSEFEKSLAVCEIINTLTKTSNYSVQILIDSSNTGIGEVVSYQDLGFDSEYDKDKDYFSAALFTNSIVATAKTELLYAFDCIKAGDYKKASLFFDDSEKDNAATARKLMSFFEYRIVLSYKVDDFKTVSGVSTLNFSMDLRDNTRNENISLRNKQLTLNKLGELYKIDLNQFITLLGE